MREKILEGKKTVTRRIWSRPHVKRGGIYQVRRSFYKPGYYFKIKVLSIRKEKLGEMVRARGKALVEERARRLVAAGAECFFRTPIKGSILSKCDKGIYCDWTTCPIKDEKRQDAREQLRAEGVIR
jgi:hypothetical protein